MTKAIVLTPYPFGSAMPTRGWSDANRQYRYGFNGKEEDKEGLGGGSSTYDYGFRIYNPSLGKFLSVDPLSKFYPWYTPYQFAGNKPIWAIDLDGLEEYFIQQFTLKNSSGKTFIYKVIYRYIEPKDRTDNADMLIDPEPINFTNSVFQEYLINFNPSGTSQSIYKTGFKIVQTFKKLIKNKSEVSFFSRISKSLKKYGYINMIISPKIYFGNDEGNTKEELKTSLVSNNNMEAIDNVASVLINDPNAHLTITGSASKLATNIDGTKEKTEEDNNMELANQRADAGVELLKEILKEKYHKSDSEIDKIMERVTKKAIVQGDSSDPEETQKQNRYTEFKLE